ncbi:hypothetical protein, partial [Sanguibacter suarezii]|uniref:hypothetical protein n=1 Tax=Sanguibacter suarezii TaxID=60921 RepID=UPI001C3F23F2
MTEAARRVPPRRVMTVVRVVMTVPTVSVPPSTVATAHRAVTTEAARRVPRRPVMTVVPVVMTVPMVTARLTTAMTAAAR